MSADTMIKHWLLNLAVEHPVWLGHLFPDVGGEALNVKPVPGCDKGDYARGLAELFDSGMIRLSSEVAGDDVESAPGVERILDRFLKLAGDDPAHYRHGRLRPTHERNRLPGLPVSFELTALGGAAWEGMAGPDWARILTASADDSSVDLFSPDRHLLMAYMGWYPEIAGRRIRRDAITWQAHADFAILYWKRLPLVYQASCCLEPAGGPGEPRWSKAPPWFREWHSSVIAWRKQPWDLEGWPSSREDRPG